MPTLPSTEEWKIEIDNFMGGFAPGYYKNDYPSIGKPNQAGKMANIDLRDPDFVTQGPGLSNLTNGTQADAVTTLIKGMLQFPIADDVSYGVGGAELYEFSSSAVTNAGNWPHTIDKAAVTAEDGEDVLIHQGKLYATYNHSGGAGDICQVTDPNGSETFDDDWGSTTDVALENAPHKLMLGGDDVMYIANGRYVGTYDGTTLDVKNLDFRVDAEVADLHWHENSVWVFANLPNVTGSNLNEGIIYLWNGTDASWFDSIKVLGRIGAAIVKGGRVYVFFQDITNTNLYTLGVVSGNTIEGLKTFTGTVPLYYQVSVEEGFIIWESDGLMYAWGSNDPELPARSFQLADNGHSTVGGVTNCFGTPIIASFDGSTGYRLAKHANYETATCNWKSLMHKLSTDGRSGFLDEMEVHFDTLASGARCDFSTKHNRGASGITIGNANFTDDGAVRKKIFYPAIEKIQDIRIDCDWTSGSTTQPFKLQKIILRGHFEYDW